RGHHQVQRPECPGSHLLLRSASARSRRPPIRVELPASALRRVARLFRRDVHPHPAGPGRSPAEGLVSELRRTIEQEIQQRGPIPFSRYMELCLYHPQLGYYSRHSAQFGKAGDFYTSSDVHAVFGRLLARQFAEMWHALGSPAQIVVKELGPGRGLFAQDVLDWSEKKFPEFFCALRYVLVEQSPALRERIGQTLMRRLESGQAGFGSLHQPADSPVIVFANEFFDAIPVEVVSVQGSLRIDAREGRFFETWAPPSTEES